MVMKKTLKDYLDMFSWSQADLAREAQVSTHCVRRALRGEPIARRNASAIADALTARLQSQGVKGTIGVQSIHGLKLADVQRPASTSKKKQPTDSPGGQEGQP